MFLGDLFLLLSIDSLFSSKLRPVQGLSSMNGDEQLPKRYWAELQAPPNCACLLRSAVAFNLMKWW